MVANVETEGHSWVDLGIVDLLRRLLMVIDMVLFYRVQVVLYRRLRAVRVIEN